MNENKFWESEVLTVENDAIMEIGSSHYTYNLKKEFYSLSSGYLSPMRYSSFLL
jgi:hypothetical protein